MQAEGQLDNERNAALGEALLQLVLERLDVAARCQAPGLEMLPSDDAEMLGRYRLAVLLHRRQQFLDARIVDALDAKELRQRLVRAAGLGQDVALHGGAGKSPELGDKFPHRALTLKLAVSGNVRSDVTLQPALVVPMRIGGVAALGPLRHNLKNLRPLGRFLSLLKVLRRRSRPDLDRALLIAATWDRCRRRRHRGPPRLPAARSR